MKINKDSLAARAKNLSEKYGVSANAVYSRYFFDCFLSRLSSSAYSDKFILKGGLYLSSVLGIENRTTMDIDFIIRKLKLEHDSIVSVIKEICEIPADDNVKFFYVGDSRIKKDDIYGGFSISLEGKLDNVRQRFDVDIATNDVVYPKDCDYSYQCLVTGEVIKIKSYSIESVIAEKMQTFLVNGVLNSRAKDLYDLYVLYNMHITNSGNLRMAFAKTCERREFETNKEKALETLRLVESNKNQKQRWEIYSKKMKYANNVTFEDVVFAIKGLIEDLL